MATGGGAERWCLRCRDAGERCSLTLGGDYEDVLGEGVAHWRRRHGARGTDAEVRGAVAELMRRQDFESLWPPEMSAEGERPARRDPDWPF